LHCYDFETSEKELFFFCPVGRDDF